MQGKVGHTSLTALRGLNRSPLSVPEAAVTLRSNNYWLGFCSFPASAVNPSNCHNPSLQSLGAHSCYST